MASQKDEFDIHNFLNIPALYEILSSSTNDPPSHILDEDQTKNAEEVLCAALNTRLSSGRKLPLHDISMAELLQRFSTAAFFVHRDEYLKNDIDSPEKILMAPLTPEEIRKIEEELGPLPEDVKEMALIADGFYCGWHFAGGGWPGIGSLFKDNTEDYGIYLGYIPEPEKRVETRTREDGTEYKITVNMIAFGGKKKEAHPKFGDCYVSAGALEENDNFMHILCPAAVWKEIQAKMGKTVKDGEYAYVNYMNWGGGGDL
jgi:hypothetical protein